MTQTCVRLLVLVVAVVAALSPVGCGSKRLGRYDIVVTPDASLRDASSGELPLVEVDLVGVSENDTGNWSGQGVDQHFSGENAVRAGAREFTRTFTFSKSDREPKTLKMNDPIWDVWQKRGVTTLYVFGSARTFKPAPGAPERRRLPVPLTTDNWESGTRKIDIVLRSGGVDLATAMKVKK